MSEVASGHATARQRYEKAYRAKHRDRIKAQIRKAKAERKLIKKMDKLRRGTQ
jgi:hypothetical protein